MNEYVLYFTMISLVFGAFSALKLAFRKETSNVLIGEGLMAVIIATFLVILAEIYSIAYVETVALLLLVCGPIGTIAFSKFMKKGSSAEL
ncbi:monovalent cation/H+ antiporter complex subunit F [Methanococcus sp. CF]|jgi:energy-converting hydrogenase B subunit B